MINSSGVIANAEPYGIFSPLIPASATAPGGDLHHTRARQGIVPDLLITYPAENGPASNQLAELKCLNAGIRWYSSNQKAVDIRARELPKLYLDKAQSIDRKYRGTQVGQVGPLQQRLEGFGELQCLVVGQYGEVSQHTHDLLRKLASCKASHISQLEGRVISDQERSILLQQLRRRLSVSIITAQSNCLLSRLNHISPHAKQAAQRRANAKFQDEALRHDRKRHFEAYVRGKRLKHIGVIHL